MRKEEEIWCKCQAVFKQLRGRGEKEDKEGMKTQRFQSLDGFLV